MTTNASGKASYTLSPANKVAVSLKVTATATASATGDTPEFSAPRTVVTQ